MNHPREIEHFSGHQKAVNLFMQTFRSGKLFHGWLLEGPYGVGKASFAYHMACMMFDTSQKGQSRHVAAGTHPDLLEIGRTKDDKKDRLRKEIVVDDIRRVNHFLRQTPALGGWRVVIIDEAEALNHNAANSLLKILEEPPEKSVIFLICNKIGHILPTLRSRCIQLRFNKLPDQMIDKIIASQRPDITQEQRLAVILNAQGSAGMAFKLLTEDGLSLCLQVKHSVEHPASLRDNNKLVETVLKEEGNFSLFLTVLLNTLYQSTRIVLLDTEHEKPAILKNKRIQQNLSLWQTIREIANTVERFNMDKRQALLNIFDVMRTVL